MVRKYLLALLLCLPLSALAAPPIGTVLLSLGANTAQDESGQIRTLQRQAELYSGDTLITGAKGRLQLRFSDDSLLSLKPNTVFRIADYHFDASHREDDSALYELLQGSMRTVSGKIGKQDKSDYSVKTAVATIGIRGTEYEIQLCDSGCAEQRQTEEGLTGQVLDGRILIAGEQQNHEVGVSEFFFVSRQSGTVNVSNTPPAAYVTEEEQQQDEESAEGLEAVLEGEEETEVGETAEDADTDADADTQNANAANPGNKVSSVPQTGSAPGSSRPKAASAS